MHHMSASIQAKLAPRKRGIWRNTHPNQSPVAQRQYGRARRASSRNCDGEVLVRWVPVRADVWYLRAIHVSVARGGRKLTGIKDAA